jgi:hypothetical protein
MFTLPFGFFKAAASGPTPPAASLVAWWKADAGVTKDGSNHVSVWADQSGNGHDWGTPTGGSVTWMASQINGLPAIYSPGGTGGGAPYLTLSNFMGGGTNAPAEVFVVLKGAVGGGTSNYSWAGTSTQTDSSHWPFSTVSWYENFGSTFRSSGNASANSVFTNWAIMNVEATGSSGAANSYKGRINGTQLFATGPNNSGWASTWRLFASNATAPSGYGFNGYIAEILIYNGILSSGDRTSVLSYLNARYGL